MRFASIILPAAGVTPDPRTDPEDVPESHIVRVPRSVEGTDERPKEFALTLEGTAANTANVQFYALDEQGVELTHFADDVRAGHAERLWYSLGAAVTVTVGQVSIPSLPVLPGTLYARITTGPAAEARLKIGFV